MTDTTNEYQGATPPRKNKTGLVEETPETAEKTPLSEGVKHRHTVFGPVPDNFKPRTYMLSEIALDSLKKVFTKAEKGSGYITVGDLSAVLEEVFGIDGQPAPIAADVAYLLQKYNLESNYAQLSFTVFRQLVLDLVSPKHYSLLENKGLKLQGLKEENNTPPGDSALGLKNLYRAFSVQILPQHRIHFDLEVDNPKRSCELSPEGGSIAKRIFMRYADQETNLMDFKRIFGAISEVLEADSRLPPLPSLFVHILQKKNVNEGESISLKKFQQLIQEICVLSKGIPDACNYYMS